MTKKDDVLGDDIFATCDTMEEAEELRDVVNKYSPWALLFTLAPGKFGVGGLTRHGGKMSRDDVAEIELALEEHIKQQEIKDIDPKKFQETLKELSGSQE